MQTLDDPPDTRPLTEPEPEPDTGATATRPWVSSLLLLGLGALIVFAIVALVVPSRLTDPSRLDGKVLVGATLDGPVKLQVAGTPDVEIARLVVPPGQTMQWHVHRGYMITSVTAGIATFYDGDDPHCRPHPLRPGEALVDPPDFPHTVRNEGSVPLVLYNVAITQQGKASVKDVPANPACGFVKATR